MLDIIWFLLIFSGTFFISVSGNSAAIPKLIADSTESAIAFSIKLGGMLAFWSGILKIAESAAIIETIAEKMRPLTRRLFPTLQSQPKIIGLITATLAANMLGLGNVATSSGLKTMDALQKINPDSEQPSNEMCVFLSLILGGFCLLPTTLITIRSQAGAAEPDKTWCLTIIASIISTITSLCLNRFLNRHRR